MANEVGIEVEFGEGDKIKRFKVWGSEKWTLLYLAKFNKQIEAEQNPQAPPQIQQPMAQQAMADVPPQPPGLAPQQPMPQRPPSPRGILG